MMGQIYLNLFKLFNKIYPSSNCTLVELLSINMAFPIVGKVSNRGVGEVPFH